MLVSNLFLQAGGLREQLAQSNAELKYVKTGLEEARSREHAALQALDSSNGQWEKTIEDLHAQVRDFTGDKVIHGEQYVQFDCWGLQRK